MHKTKRVFHNHDSTKWIPLYYVNSVNPHVYFLHKKYQEDQDKEQAILQKSDFGVMFGGLLVKE